jgi:hypothetical protein
MGSITDMQGKGLGTYCTNPLVGSASEKKPKHERNDWPAQFSCSWYADADCNKKGKAVMNVVVARIMRETATSHQISRTWLYLCHHVLYATANRVSGLRA